MLKTANAWIAQMIMEQKNVLAMDLFQDMVSVPVFHTVLNMLILVITIITKLFLGVEIPLPHKVQSFVGGYKNKYD